MKLGRSWYTQAASCRRRRAAAASWTHTGTHYLSSDGASGSYADAATSSAAAIIVSVAGSDYTVSCWLRFDGPLGAFGCAWDVAAAGISGIAQIGAFDDGGDALTGSFGDVYGTDYSTMRFVVVVSSGGLTDVFVDGVSSVASTTPLGDAGLAFTLFADYAHANCLAGDLRDVAVWDRALSAAEVAALHTAGAGHDLREDVGAYTGGGPEHWWPADGDSGTTVTDRGSVGGCNLTLHGGVTIEAV